MERLTEYSDLAGVQIGDLKSGVDERAAFHRLAAYEDTGRMPEEIKALLISLSNEPLSEEDLKRLDGEPVWIVFSPDPDGKSLSLYALVAVDEDDGEIYLTNSLGGRSAYREVSAIINAIYRQKPSL